MKTETEAVPENATETQRWEEAGDIHCLLEVSVPIRNFTVADLLRLEPGAVLSTDVPETKAVDVYVSGSQIGWGIPEPRGNSLAVRITEFLA